jgi:hypothetical protein
MVTKEADINHRITMLEMASENIDERLLDVDERVTQMEPAVKQAGNNNVVIYISLAITVINLLILLLNNRT